MLAFPRSLAFAAVAVLLAAPVFAQGEEDALWREIQNAPEAQAPAASDPEVWNAERDAETIAACLTSLSAEQDPSSCRATLTALCEGEGETYAMVACAQREAEAWERLETDARARLADDASPAMAESLDAAHEAWLAYRQTDCAAQALEFEGGSLARVLGAGCFADHTVERALILRARVADRAG